ncbi:Thioredoxin-disulfide reductase [Bertholletia excelsa]
MERVSSLVADRPVVVFSRSSSSTCHSVTVLFSEFGVNATVHDLDQMPRGVGREIEQALAQSGCSPPLPAVFISGELVGGVNEVNSLHLRQALKPMLKRAGALWV